MKLIYLLVTFLVICTSCSFFQMSDDSQEIIASITARRVGQVLAEKQPELAEYAKGVAIEIRDGEFNRDYVSAMINALLDVMVDDDPYLKADIQDLVSIFDLEAPEVSEKKIGLIRRAAGSFVRGVDLWTGDE